MISREDIEQVRKEFSIIELLNYYGAIKAKGNNAYHCFRHEDKKPSLVANESRGVLSCFSPKCDLKNKITGKDGLDIFEVIKVVEHCNFRQAYQKALNILNHDDRHIWQKGNLTNSQKNIQKASQNHSILPKLQGLDYKHKHWLLSRYGQFYDFLIDYFKIQATPYHIALPICAEAQSFVFIPILPKDHIYYKGQKRNLQIFPNQVKRQKTKKRIFVCEGEKDVLKVTLSNYRKNILEDWEAITNTNGARSLKLHFPFFENFDKHLVEEVVICYDNDEAGKEANQMVYQIAKNYFTSKTKISVFTFERNSSKGYDISDFLDGE